MLTPRQYSAAIVPRMSQLTTSIADLIDQHIAWLGAWHRLAFYPEGARAKLIENLPPPGTLTPVFRQDPALPEDQPAFEKLATLYQELHEQARLVLINTPDSAFPSRKDYDSVTAKHQELMRALRRMERAFSIASSALDPLTGLRNRNGMLDDLTREYVRFMRMGAPFCLAVMDIDHFKKINDTYGHDAGDVTLAAVANHCSRSVRAYDDVYRLGGEEFLICLKEADLTQGMIVLERMRTTLEHIPVVLGDGQIIHVTASFGIAVVTKDQAVEETLRVADMALYRAKNDGRNRVIAMA